MTNRGISVAFNAAEAQVTRRVATVTLGCKVNAFESELIVQQLSAQGYERGAVEQADVVVVNTCTVTAEADRQARQSVRKVIRDNADAKVVVTGCYAQMDPQACYNIPGVDLVIGNAQKLKIPALLSALEQGDLPPVMVDDLDGEISLPEQLVSGFSGRSRAFVQIQQGCDQGCTFCIIHKARGPNRSFDPAMIHRQCAKLINNGYREIVICGVDIGSYGSDNPESDIATLADLLRHILTLKGRYRLRLSSIDPAHIDDDLIELFATDTRLCRQFHLSMQSGNTLILKRMKRRATRELLYERIAALRAVVPEMIFSADIIAGFPTETEEQHQQSVQAIADLAIAFPHAFPYSPRQGTPAARIPNQVPKAQRKRRAAELREQGQLVWQQLSAAKLGHEVEVLMESQVDIEKQRVSARCDDYFSVQVHGSVEALQQQVGQFVKVKITGAEFPHLQGHLL